jgi:hypothetical protein
VSDLAGLLVLLAGVGILTATGFFAAASLRLRSPIDFVLGAYLVAWGWLVLVALALSPPALLTRSWILAALVLGCAIAAGFWLRAGRPAGPPVRITLSRMLGAVRSPPALVLACVASAGLAYSIVLTLFTPANDGDALAYHLARAAFWKQEHQLGYVESTVDVRLNANPPNAEIGQLATMLLSDGDRYVGLPQLAAYLALALSVVGLARCIGLRGPEAAFGGLAFTTLPVVAVQASSALNDLVVASFLAAGALFALRPTRASPVLLACALGLAVGTKLTALLALPTLLLVIVVGRPRDRLKIALAGLAGVVAGSVWYVVNVVETGHLDGGLAAAFSQRTDLALPVITTTALRLGLDLIDMSGAERPHSAVFLVLACALAAIGVSRATRFRRQAVGLIAASAVIAGIYLTPHVFDFAQDKVFRAWAALGRPSTPPFEFGWNLNVEADPVLSWYGPLGAILLFVGPALVAVLWRRNKAPPVSLAFALAPWVLLLTLAATVVWDPFRGRFLVFAVALAAATWGYASRWLPAAAGIAAIGACSLVLSLLNYQGKPSGLGTIWLRDDPLAPTAAIWHASRADAQTRLRQGTGSLEAGERAVFGFLEDEVPATARVAVAPRENELLSPYFGSSLARRVSLVRAREEVPAAAQWLVLSPSTDVPRCDGAWRSELALESGWRVERRVGADDCLDG